MILADIETKIDLINNEAIAKIVIELLRKHPEHSVTIGVHGDWGAGKSSILEMIEAGFEDDSGVLCLKFNGWRFQGFEDAKISLIEGIVTRLIEERSALTMAGEKVKSVLRRIDWLKMVKRAGALAWTAYTGIPTPEQIQGIANSFQDLVAHPADWFSKENVEKALNPLQGLLKPGEGAHNIPKEIEEFRQDFEGLLAQTEIKQLVVLVDDLDRCLPDTAIETLEAIRLFLATKRTAFVVAADEAMIEYAVRKHFPDLPAATGPQAYARNYLEKLIQVPIRIPALGEEETKIYVTLLLVGAEIGQDDPGFLQLAKVARESLCRPWLCSEFNLKTVEEALGKPRIEQVKAALLLSEQLGPILARGTSGNPRQIKRFLNSLLLRQRIAQARGFGDDIVRPVLAKLMLAESFQPRLFEQIATTAVASPNGSCEELKVLEEFAANRGAKDLAPAPGARKRTPNGNAPSKTSEKRFGERSEAILEEWHTSEDILTWAAVTPAISQADLRPYLFITKDHKTFFSLGTASGHLSEIIEHLFASRLTVQGLEGRLKALPGGDAAQVFEIVAQRIRAGDQFDTEPPGIEGMKALVKSQEGLQSDVIHFLRGLPSDKLGPWAVNGWQRALTREETRRELERLLEEWSQAGSESLKSAAAGILRLSRSRGN